MVLTMAGFLGATLAGPIHSPRHRSPSRRRSWGEIEAAVPIHRQQEAFDQPAHIHRHRTKTSRSPGREEGREDTGKIATDPLQGACYRPTIATTDHLHIHRTICKCRAAKERPRGTIGERPCPVVAHPDRRGQHDRLTRADYAAGIVAVVRGGPAGARTQMHIEAVPVRGAGWP